MEGHGWLRRLYKQGKVDDHHIEAAAKFEQLVYNGYGTKSIAPDRVYIKQPKYHANLSGLRLSRLDRIHYAVLTMAFVHDRTIFDIGHHLGAKSRTTAYRMGLIAIQAALTHAAHVL